MDPDKALANARAALAAYRSADSSRDAEQAAIDLAEAFEALDEWMSKKGFPPRAWDRKLETV
jgi:hypothetical protein